MQASCRNACVVMNTAADFVVNLRTSKRQDVSIIRQFSQLKCQRTSVLDTLFSLHPGTFPDTQTENAHLEFTLSFCRLVSALVPQMCRLTNHMVSEGHGSQNCSLLLRKRRSNHAGIFWLLWDILNVSCSVLDEWPNSWPSSLSSSDTHLIMHTLSNWLLTASRANPESWSFLRSYVLFKDQQPAPYIIIHHINCLFNLGMQSAQEVSDVLVQLPFNYLSTLSSLVCEQLAEVPHIPAVDSDKGRHAQAQMRLASALANIHEKAESCNNTTILDRLAVAPVLELFKRAMVFCEEPALETLCDISIHEVVYVLYGLLFYTFLEKKQVLSTAYPSLSCTAAHPSHEPSATLLSHAMTPDHRLASLLLRCSNTFPLLCKSCFVVIQLVECSWVATKKPRDQRASTLTVLVHYCLKHGLTCMWATRHPTVMMNDQNIPGEQQISQTQGQRQQEAYAQQRLEQQESQAEMHIRSCDGMTLILRLMSHTQETIHRMFSCCEGKTSGECDAEIIKEPQLQCCL